MNGNSRLWRIGLSLMLIGLTGLEIAGFAQSSTAVTISLLVLTLIGLTIFIISPTWSNHD